MVRACSIGQRRGAYRVFVGKSEASRPFGRPRPKREDNIKTDLRVWFTKSAVSVNKIKKC